MLMILISRTCCDASSGTGEAIQQTLQIRVRNSVGGTVSTRSTGGYVSRTLQRVQIGRRLQPRRGSMIFDIALLIAVVAITVPLLLLLLAIPLIGFPMPSAKRYSLPKSCPTHRQRR